MAGPVIYFKTQRVTVQLLILVKVQIRLSVQATEL
eukprot:SAG31_NODE_20044_length_585_cov_0.886831_2_plen_34_part_01